MARRQRSRVPLPPNPLNWASRWRKRMGNSVRQAYARGDHATMLMVWALLVMPALAFEAGSDVQGLWSLILIGLISASLSYLLAWSNLSEGMALLVSSSYGLAIIAVTEVMAAANGNSPTARVDNFITRLGGSLTDIFAGQANDDTLIIVVFGAIFWWFLAHNTVWHIFRVDRVWRAITPPALLLLAFATQYEGDAPLDVFIIFYVLISLLLIIRSHIDAREYEWYRQQVRYPARMRQYFLRVGATMAIIFVLLAWIFPTGKDQKDQSRLEEFLNNLGRLSEILEQLLSPIESDGVASADYYGGDNLDLSGAISLGDGLALEVQAPYSDTIRYYWRSTVFDTYQTGSWTHTRGVRATKEDEGLQLNIGTTVPASRQNVRQTIFMRLNASSLIYAAPQPIYFGVPVKVELDCVTDITSTACINQNLEVDTSITRAVKPIRAGQSYEVESSVSVATADMLRAANTTYPTWVTSRYLQGSDQTPRLQELASQIVLNSGAVTAYDKAKAIERWLRANIAYNETIPNPPAGQDPIEWVVFDYKQGYCNYYASAMILMLRSQGVPARMAAGFSQGDFKPDRNVYEVREKDAHTWVEVYFPDYGWVNFEPTANEQPLDRSGDTPEQPQQTATPLPTPTPTITPTVTPTSGGDSIASPTPQQNEQQIALTQTPTPTFTPLPTATPFPVNQPQETQIDSGDGLGLLGIILGSLLVALLLVVLAVVAIAFTIWWVEHRGLGGLSMVEKAYARLAIYGNWLGITLPPQHTPEERRVKLVDGVPKGEPPINDITSFYVQSHFAPPQKRADLQEKAAQAWTTARWAFIRQKIRGWLPWG